MVTRLIMSPSSGLTISRPGFDASVAASPKLIDPDWSNLQLHVRGSTTAMVDNGGNDRREWYQIVNFAALPEPPMAFINGRMPGIAYTDYPASFPPVTTYTIIGGGTDQVANYFTITESQLIIRIFTDISNTVSPVCSWMIMKNKRVSQ